MKYKRLPKTELEKLEKEFINFLAVNSITADDWKEKQATNDESIELLIDDFSDMIYHRVMHKINFIDHRSVSELKVFNTNKEKIILYGLRINDNSFDLTDGNDLEKIFNGNIPNGLEVYRMEKQYSKERELEIFEMLERGCCVVDKKLYTFLEKIHRNA